MDCLDVLHWPRVHIHVEEQFESSPLASALAERDVPYPIVLSFAMKLGFEPAWLLALGQEIRETVQNLAYGLDWRFEVLWLSLHAMTEVPIGFYVRIA